MKGPEPQGEDAGARDAARIERLVDAFVRLVRRGAPFAVAYGMVAAALALLQLPGWILTFGAASGVTGDLGGLLSVAGGCFGCLSLLAGPVAAAVLTGLARPARRALLEDAPAPAPLAILEEATRGFVPLLLAALLFMLAVVVGTALCVLPGLVAYLFLVFVPYLVATQDLDLGAAITRSIELAQRHVVPLVVVVVAVATVAFGALLATWLMTLVATQALGPAVGTAVAAPLGYVVWQVAALAAWFWTTAALVAIESSESGPDPDGVAA